MKAFGCKKRRYRGFIYWHIHRVVGEHYLVEDVCAMRHEPRGICAERIREARARLSKKAAHYLLQQGETK